MLIKNSKAFYSRIKLLLSSCIDFFIIGIFFYKTFNLDNIFYLGIRIYFYIFFWILISYLFDRYKQNNTGINKSDFLNQILCSFKSIIVFGLVFLLFNWTLGNYISRFFLINLISTIFFFSTIAQYLINKIFYKKLINSKYWVFYMKDEDLNEIEKNEFLKDESINILFIKNISNNVRIINDAYGIILKDYENISDEDIRFLLSLKKKGKLVYKLSNWFKDFLKRYPPYFLVSKDFLEVDFLLTNNSLVLRLKRIGDIFISLFLLIFSLPIVLIASILIYLEDRGPIFYYQKRTGYLGGIFTIVKLRSMRVDAEKKGIRWSAVNDSRITNVGKFIRKTRIDELPQLLSVFNGDMSLIGPRPERPEFDEFLSKEIPFYNMRYLLRPGLSGWAQVNYPYGASKKDTINKLSFDLYYISNYSLFLDANIFFKTLRLIINAKGSKPSI